MGDTNCLCLTIAGQLIALGLASQSGSDHLLRLGLQDGYVELQVAEKAKTSTSSVREYYWVKGQQLLVTQGGVAGRPLHGAYRCFRDNGQLKETGRFVFGLKDGEWREWHPDGKLKEVTQWRSGLQHGTSRTYDTNGNLATEVRYRRGKLRAQKTRQKEKESKPEGQVDEKSEPSTKRRHEERTLKKGQNHPPKSGKKKASQSEQMPNRKEHKSQGQ